jgi:hypothetical protein
MFGDEEVGACLADCLRVSETRTSELPDHDCLKAWRVVV